MHKVDEVQLEILEAAKRIFQRWGLKKATMEDIAAEAGKAKSTLYYYYKSKEEIFDAAVMQEISNILVRAKAAVAAIESPKQRLKNYVAASLTELKKYALMYMIVWKEIRDKQQSMQKFSARFEAMERIYYKEVLTQGASMGEFSFKDERELDAYAKTISGIVRALLFYLFLDTDETEQIDITANLIANGI
jgi:AcrR family transcriptional regulator